MDKRWVKDREGKVWSSGGVSNGCDMMAAYLRDVYGGERREIVEFVLGIADVGERGEDYESK